MFVLIPTAIGQQIPAEVLDALSLHGDVEPVQIATPGVINSQGNGSLQRIHGEARSRNACAIYAGGMRYEYIGMLDRDIVLPIGTIYAMREEMRSDLSIGALGIRIVGRSLIKGHVQLGFTLWRNEVLQQVNWNVEPAGCFCLYVSAELKRLGYIHRYAQCEAAVELKI